MDDEMILITIDADDVCVLVVVHITNSHYFQTLWVFVRDSRIDIIKVYFKKYISNKILVTYFQKVDTRRI